MARSILFLILLFANGKLVAQETSLGFELITRYDRHADYESNYGRRAYNDQYKLWGTSYGTNVFLKKQLRIPYQVRIAIGYYRLGIDKIEGTLPFNAPGVSTARNIRYDDGSTNLLYSTSEYCYNNLSLTFGVSRHFRLNHKSTLDFGADVSGYYTVSQKYVLFDGPNHYDTSNSKPWELGVNVNLGLIRTIGKYYIEPALVTSIFQKMKGDRVFYEDPKMDIVKWFHGLGLLLRIGRFI